MSNHVSRRNVSGFTLFVLGVLFSWQSKAEQKLMLSSSEADWTALSETVKEVMCMIQLLGSRKISVKFPVMVRADNIGATYHDMYQIHDISTKHS